MNEAQTIFALFFEIPGGLLSTFLPRWRPFHYALWWRRDFFQPTRRIISAWIALNLAPWLLFALIYYCLRGRQHPPETLTICDAFRLIWRAILPGFVPFGCYRLWI